MNGGRKVALWAGLSAFFGNIVGLKLLELITGDEWGQLLSAVVISAFVAGAVYSKERLQAARRSEGGSHADV